MRTVRIVTAALLVMALSGASLGLTGCDRVAEEASEALVEGVSGVDIEEDGDTVTIEGEDGSSVEIQGSESELPDGFPADVPVYDAAIEGSSKIAVDGQTSYSVSQTTGDAFDDVVAWFDGELPDSGWTVTGNTSSDVDGAQFAMLVASKADNELTIGVQREDSDTQITYTVISGE